MIQYEHLRSESTYHTKIRILLRLEHCRDFIRKSRRSAGHTKYKGHRRFSSKKRSDKELNLIGSTGREVCGSEAVTYIISIVRPNFKKSTDKPDEQYATFSKTRQSLIQEFFNLQIVWTGSRFVEGASPPALRKWRSEI